MYQSIRETGNAAAPETTTLTSVNPSAALSFFLIKDETKGIFKNIFSFFWDILAKIFSWNFVYILGTPWNVVGLVSARF